jgi:GTP-binding protein EngB required for normal cell division
MILTTDPPTETKAHTLALDLASEIAERYEISTLSGLLATVRNAIRQDEITVAVLGRFKAGKSSFLNDFTGRAILPVGVIPVTAVVTEMRYGAHERAVIRFQDGASREIPLDQIGGYISERENPENTKRVAIITVELPELRPYRGLKFVDTPGLESAHAHNTQASLDWLPNVGMALVAVSVDPPLSQRDIDLLQSLHQYTPKVCILLTKADLLSAPDLEEVLEFVRSQLARRLSGNVQVFPYSTKPGFENFRTALDEALRSETLDRFAEEREAILARKMETLLGECAGYLALSLKSAELIQSERDALKEQVVGEKEVLDEAKAQVRLLVQHAAAGTRAMVANRLEQHEREVDQALLDAFAREFPNWTRSLATMLSSFEEWLSGELRDHLMVLSVREHIPFLTPLRGVQKQAFRTLQQFRDRLSDRTVRAFGVPLRTTETEICVIEPGAPNIRIGRVFDRNWELLSPVLPAKAIRQTVRRHFTRTIARLVYQNISRLSSQWEESINSALWSVEKEARRRLDELMATVQRLVENASNERIPEIRADLERIQSAQEALARARD